MLLPLLALRLGLGRKILALLLRTYQRITYKSPTGAKAPVGLFLFLPAYCPAGGVDGNTLNRLCKYFNCQSGDLMEYVPDPVTEWQTINGGIS
ncbi:helix-turn-helix domain-containing protein [Oscillibacter sp.]|uniref:helix-turn-helix domain-containing protein n=1 Tax=Oscillibacter sp. TaxID=1945593 RepID=UPI003394CDDF